MFTGISVISIQLIFRWNHFKKNTKIWKFCTNLRLKTIMTLRQDKKFEWMPQAFYTCRKLCIVSNECWPTCCYVKIEVENRRKLFFAWKDWALLTNQKHNAGKKRWRHTWNCLHEQKFIHRDSVRNKKNHASL